MTITPPRIFTRTILQIVLDAWRGYTMLSSNYMAGSNIWERFSSLSITESLSSNVHVEGNWGGFPFRSAKEMLYIIVILMTYHCVCVCVCRVINVCLCLRNLPSSGKLGIRWRWHPRCRMPLPLCMGYYPLESGYLVAPHQVSVRRAAHPARQWV